MADPDLIAQAPPLEITVSPTARPPTFTPEGRTGGGAGAGGQAAPTIGDDYLRQTQAEQARHAREILGGLAEGDKPAGGAKAPAQPTEAAPQTWQEKAIAARNALVMAPVTVGKAYVAASKDVARSLPQAPAAIVGGAGEAVRQLSRAGASLDQWLSEKTGGMIGTSLDEYKTLLRADPKTAADANLPDAELWKRIEKSGNELLKSVVPSIGKPDTVTGGLIHDAAQFLTGMAVGGKLLEGMTIPIQGFGKAVATGAFSDFAARDPDAAKLADLIEKHPALKNPVTGFLQAKEDDPEVMKRLKAALEGAGMGVVTEGFIRGLRVLKARNKAGQAAGNDASLLTKMEEDAAAKFGRMSDEAMALIGDPTAPLVSARTPGQKASVAAKRIDAAGRDFDGAPLQSPTTIKAYHGSPSEFTSFDAAKIGSGEGGKLTEGTGHYFTSNPLLAHEYKDFAKGPKQNIPNGKEGGPGHLYEVELHVKPEELMTWPRIALAKQPPEVQALAKEWKLTAAESASGREIYAAIKAKIMAKDATLTEAAAEKETARIVGEKVPGSKYQEPDLHGGLHTNFVLFPGNESRAKVVRRNGQAVPDPNDTRSADEIMAALEAKLEANTSNISTQELANGLVKTVDAGGNDIYVNFARIDSPEAVKKTIGLMADAGQARIDAKRGGAKQTFREMEGLADDLGMDVTDLLSRRSGAPMSAAEALAARSLLVASGSRLTELARNIAGGTARPAEEFAFRRQMALHAAIQAEVIAARTETARALASWNIPRGGSLEASKSIHETLEAMGGSATTHQLALRLSQLSAQGLNSPAKFNDFVRKSATAATIDAAMEAWKSALLSGPTTHLSNMFSNTLTMGVMTGERRVAAMISDFRGTVDGVAAGEADAMVHGLVESSKDAFRMAWAALKTGDSEFGRASGKADMMQTRAISREALGLPDNVWGNAVDYLGKGFNVPFRLLTAEDEFFKTMTFRMELHAQAQRVAVSEGLTGEAAFRRMREVIDNPPEVVKLAAQDFALAATYNRELTGALQKIGQARGDDGAMGRALQFVLPFFRTPVNVFTASMERSPLAPLTAQFRADVQAGGARQDLALARMATGTTIMAIAADLADRGMITGSIGHYPQEREARERQGIPQYSIKIGNKWVSYNKLDPIAMPMAVAANMAELARRFEIEPDKVDSVKEIVGAGVAATAKAALDRSFMQGTAGILSAIENPEEKMDAYLKSQIAGFFTPAISNTVAQLSDPTKRETFDALDAIEARIAGLSRTLIPRMDLWGREVRIAESGAGRVFDVISPIKVQSDKPNPIDAELIRLNFFPKRIDKKGHWDGAPVEFSKYPEVYAAYAKLAGNDLKEPQYDGKGMMDFLNSVVEGKSSYNDYWKILTDGAEGGKAQFIQKVVQDYRKAARREIEGDPRFTKFRQYLVKQGGDEAAKKAKTQEERDIAPSIPRLQ